MPQPKKKKTARAKSLADIGVIGGSGLYSMSGLSNTREMRIKTPFGDPSTPSSSARWKASALPFLPATAAAIAFSPPNAFPRQHLRHEATWRAAYHFRQRRWLPPGQSSAGTISHPRPVLRQHQGPQVHLFRQRYRRSRHLRQTRLPATLCGPRRSLPRAKRAGPRKGHLHVAWKARNFPRWPRRTIIAP